jgi:choline dehydrogenase-like flavoprotein
VANSAYKTLFRAEQDIFLKKDKNGTVKGADIDINFEQRPNRDSRVTLGNELDKLGQRRVALDWRLTADDKRTARRAYELSALAFGSMALGRTRIRLDTTSDENWQSHVGSSHHHSGTARMASDPERGVVDRHCRVHSTENLYVVGSAVFPTTGFANPTLTITALSVRLAAHLKETLK